MASKIIHVEALSNEGYDNDGNEDLNNREESTEKVEESEANDDFIICVFVAEFHTKEGNKIEWQYPHDVDLNGVEFKAITSGAHTVKQDFVYFSHQDCYGLSCFAWKSVENTDERGARMKAAGIMCRKYTSLHEHIEFLEQQVMHLLDNPSRYHAMQKYYETYRKCPTRNNCISDKHLLNAEQLFTVDKIEMLRITHPSGCFSQFVKHFSEKVFVLWKMILLKQSIIFEANPPAGAVGFRVYCTCLLASHAAPVVCNLKPLPLFYINISDIPRLQNTKEFVAYTTESIFEQTNNVYDVYVKDQNINCTQRISCLKNINSADRRRYKALKSYSDQQMLKGKDVTDDERILTRFFIEENHRLFKTLFEVSSRQDKSLTLIDVEAMGLDPSGDRLFINDLIELYNFNIVLPTECC